MAYSWTHCNRNATDVSFHVVMVLSFPTGRNHLGAKLSLQMAEIATQCESLDFWTFEPWWNLSSAQRPKGVMTFHVSRLWIFFRCNSCFFAPTLNNFITKMPSNLNTWVAKNGLFDLTCFFSRPSSQRTVAKPQFPKALVINLARRWRYWTWRCVALFELMLISVVLMKSYWAVPWTYEISEKTIKHAIVVSFAGGKTAGRR